MQRYVIEREIPAIGGFTAAQFKAAASTSCDALRELAPRLEALQLQPGSPVFAQIKGVAVLG